MKNLHTFEEFLNESQLNEANMKISTGDKLKVAKEFSEGSIIFLPGIYDIVATPIKVTLTKDGEEFELSGNQFRRLQGNFTKIK